MTTVGHVELQEKLNALPRGGRKALAEKHNLHPSRISAVVPGGKMPDRQLTGIFLAEYGIAWDAWDKPASKRRAKKAS